VPKNIAKCIKIRQNIEKYCNPKSLIFLSFTGEIVYFVRFLFFPSNLHTVEVTGSNPVSPTTLKCSDMPKFGEDNSEIT